MIDEIVETDTQGEHTIQESLEILNSLFATGIPRSLQAQTANISLTARDIELSQRHEMYKDPFTREMVKVIITRAIGASQNENITFEIKIKERFKKDLPEKLTEELERDFEYLEELIDKTLMEIALDSQFYGDGYVRKIFKEGEGITDLLSNFSTKALNVTPIETNFNNTIAYEVSTSQLFQQKNRLRMGNHERQYVPALHIARLNALKNGVEEPSVEQYLGIDNMNVFTEKETPFEGGLYGGVMEGCYDDFINYKWAIDALSNTRISSSITERFIIHNLNNVGGEEKKALTSALNMILKKAVDNLKDREIKKDPTTKTANYIIPTTGEGTNGIDIRESTPNTAGLNNIEDIMVYLQKHVASVGFSMELTPFGGSSQGGLEKDGSTQSSLQMEAQATQIRKAIRNYIIDITLSHIQAKHGIEIKPEILEVGFHNILNQTKLLAEQQRMETVSNTQQFLGILEQFKGLALEDNEENREMIKLQIIDILPQSQRDKEDTIETLTTYILTKAETEEDME